MIVSTHHVVVVVNLTHPRIFPALMLLCFIFHTELLNIFRQIDKNIFNFRDNSVVQILPYGDPKYNNIINDLIFVNYPMHLLNILYLLRDCIGYDLIQSLLSLLSRDN